ncbi:MAG: tetratricopeptide repeat protein [Gammaproteobacteria bacterium]|nr:tetratricopeptide repeat protein [Deltaproteobacteria bacterium]NIW10541.1 tetratricopeptide repeat protein [Gammaproteobacteria bacterium]
MGKPPRPFSTRGIEAVPLHKRSLKITEKALGPDHPNVATTLREYGRALQADWQRR